MIHTKIMGRKPLGKERLDITLPKGMKEQLQEIATAEGQTLSDLFADLAREFLRKRERAK
jgi:metal-responsive CopG/Arc/MetJ family transcriptional regulator